MAAGSPDAIESTSGPGRATPGGTGSPARRASPSPTAFAPYSSSVSASTSGTMPLTRATVTVPSSPSTRTRVPSAIRTVASRVPTTPGMPYSREMIAACDRAPPLSVMIALSNGSRMLKASVVASVSSTSPCWIRSKSLGPATRRTIPSRDAGAGAEAADHRLLVRLLGDPEHLAHRGPQRGHQPGHRRRELRQVGHRRRVVADVRRGVLRGVGLVVGVPLGQLVGRRRRRALDQGAHLVDVREHDVLGIVQTAAFAASRRPAASAARRISPDAQMSE